MAAEGQGVYVRVILADGAQQFSTVRGSEIRPRARDGFCGFLDLRSEAGLVLARVGVYACAEGLEIAYADKSEDCYVKFHITNIV